LVLFISVVDEGVDDATSCGPSPHPIRGDSKLPVTKVEEVFRKVRFFMVPGVWF
jgi:hypothetical protein